MVIQKMRKEIKILAYFFGTIIILFGALFLSEAAFEFGSPDKVRFMTWLLLSWVYSSFMLFIEVTGKHQVYIKYVNGI